MNRRRVIRLATIGAALAGLVGWFVAEGWDHWFEKRVRVVVPGRIIGGAWQKPGPLGRLLRREKVRTVVTLTAINRDDPKYGPQERLVRAAGVDWVLIPMRGSTATLDQLREATDLLADPARQPVYFHCVAGHHRTGLVQAAYRIRHEGWSADQAWRELARLPWTRPDLPRDREDRRLIEAFAERERRESSTPRFAAATR